MIHSLRYPAFLSMSYAFFILNFVSVDFIKIKQVVHIAHIQYFTSSSEKTFVHIEKTAYLRYAVIVFYL